MATLIINQIGHNHFQTTTSDGELWNIFQYNERGSWIGEMESDPNENTDLCESLEQAIQGIQGYEDSL